MYGRGGAKKLGRGLSREKMATIPEVHVNTVSEEPEGERLKPLDPKSTRNFKSRGSSLKHKARFPTESVKQSEESLRHLLDDFEHGRLNAFGVYILAVALCSIGVSLQANSCIHIPLLSFSLALSTARLTVVNIKIGHYAR